MVIHRLATLIWLSWLITVWARNCSRGESRREMCTICLKPTIDVKPDGVSASYCHARPLHVTIDNDFAWALLGSAKLATTFARKDGTWNRYEVIDEKVNMIWDEGWLIIGDLYGSGIKMSQAPNCEKAIALSKKRIRFLEGEEKKSKVECLLNIKTSDVSIQEVTGPLVPFVPLVPTFQEGREVPEINRQSSRRGKSMGWDEELIEEVSGTTAQPIQEEISTQPSISTTQVYLRSSLRMPPARSTISFEPETSGPSLEERISEETWILAFIMVVSVTPIVGFLIYAVFFRKERLFEVTLNVVSERLEPLAAEED